jgi:NAD(P)-dependent dehydrogenase (short-subunit alcohol dehydrogenase family)
LTHVGHDDIPDAWKQAVPLGRVGQPLDIAKGVVFLVSSDTQFITGANLIIDGGVNFNAGALNIFT